MAAAALVLAGLFYWDWHWSSSGRNPVATGVQPSGTDLSGGPESSLPNSSVLSSQVTTNLPALFTNAFAARLLDPAIPRKERRRWAFELAKSDSPEAREAVRLVLTAGESYVKAALAEGLGEGRDPEALRLLAGVAEGVDEIAARGAIRGLGVRGDSQSARLLGELLFDQDKPESIRVEAALALGKTEHPEGLGILLQASETLSGEGILEGTLDGLARRPISETESLFTRLLEAPTLESSDRVRVLEALGETPGEVGPFLLKYISDQDPDVRAAALWALYNADTEIPIASPLVDLLRKESVPEVRRRIYDLLGTGQAVDAAAVLEMVRRETDPVARISALNWAAGEAHAGVAEARVFFDETAVPLLTTLALSPERAEGKLASVMALRRAQTPTAQAALEQIIKQSPDPRIVEAARLTPLR